MLLVTVRYGVSEDPSGREQKKRLKIVAVRRVLSEDLVKFLSSVYVELVKLFVELFVDSLFRMSDIMSSVSNNSKFSIKLQLIIKKQDGQIAAMRKVMIAAGLDPDAIVSEPGEVLGEVSDIQYVRHAHYRLYIQGVKAKKDRDRNCQGVVAVVPVANVEAGASALVATLAMAHVKVSKGVEVAVLLQAPPQINDVVRAPVAAKVTKVAKVVKVVKHVEVAKLPRALSQIFVCCCCGLFHCQH